MAGDADDPIRAELSLTDIEISLLRGAGFAIIFALAGHPCGRLADAVNRRNFIAGGVVLWSAATIACGLAFDFWSFFGARQSSSKALSAALRHSSITDTCFPNGMAATVNV